MSNGNRPIYCPFCGNTDRRVSVRRMGNKGYKVVCGKCGASGPYVAIKDWHDNKFIAQGQAIKLWNERNPLKEILGKLRGKEVDHREQAREELDEMCLEMFHLHESEADGIKQAINTIMEVHNDGKTVQKLQEQETAEGRNPESQAGEC